MSTYTVTDTPAQLVLGGGNTQVSIVNNGPSTVYLEDNTAVSVLNGIPLPPTGQMTWNSKTPLWVVCDSGRTAILTINDSAGRIDASRAKFWKPLWTKFLSLGGQNYGFADLVETSHCETILIKLRFTDPGNTTPPWFRITPTWYDTEGNILHSERIDVWALYFNASIDGTIIIKLPVIGAFVSFQTAAFNGDVGFGNLKQIDVLGTDKTFPYSYFCSSADNTAGVVTAFFDGGTPQAGTLDHVDFVIPNNYPTVYLACLGQHVSVGYNVAALTAGGTRQFRTGSTNIFLKATTFAVGNNLLYDEILVPQKVLLTNRNAGLTGPNTLSLNVNWAP